MVYEILIPLGILIMPWVLVRFVFATVHTRHMPYTKHAVYLWAATALWLLALVMPQIPMPETETFSMHMTGGVVAAVLFAYALRAYDVQFENPWQRWVGLFMFVSTLGVINELFELWLAQLRYPGMIMGDEAWDLLANTIGSLAGYSVIRLAAGLFKK